MVRSERDDGTQPGRRIVSNLEAEPVEYDCAAGPSTRIEILEPREVPLGGPRAMLVRRTLPQRDRSLVGAWCFADHYGPEDVRTHAGMDVAPHPHTGLQTVSWLFSGEIEHRDSAGVHAMVRPGELNLMTAGAGICHSEVSTDATHFLHGVQLWVALPDSAPALWMGAGIGITPFVAWLEALVRRGERVFVSDYGTESVPELYCLERPVALLRVLEACRTHGLPVVFKLGLVTALANAGWAICERATRHASPTLYLAPERYVMIVRAGQLQHLADYSSAAIVVVMCSEDGFGRYVRACCGAALCQRFSLDYLQVKRLKTLRATNQLVFVRDEEELFRYVASMLREASVFARECSMVKTPNGFLLTV